MNRLRSLALTASLVALVAARTLAGDVSLTSALPELDPQGVFRGACDRLKKLESRHDALRGVSKVKPSLQLDDNQKFKSAQFVYAQNAVPPGKHAAKAKDAAQPFVYVSVQVWAGHSLQPPADLQGFRWEGQEYEAWVQVYGSDAELVKAIRKAVAEPIFAPATKN